MTEPKVVRYQCIFGGMEGVTNGSWVRYSDYEALLAENKRLREALEHICRMEVDWRQGVAENMERPQIIAEDALKEKP